MSDRTVLPIRELWPHQVKEVREHLMDPARALFWEPRTGKTLTVIERINDLIGLEQISRALIIAPKTACSVVWEPELTQSLAFQTAFYNFSNGSMKERASLLLALKDSTYPFVVVLNPDVVWQLLPELRKLKFDFVCIDESHAIKSASSKRGNALRSLGQDAKFRMILTGTPDPENYVDYYGQYKFLAPGIFGTRKADFLERYTTRHPRYPSIIMQYLNTDELRDKIFSVASRVTRAEVWGATETPPVIRKVELPPKARKAYDKLSKEGVLEVETGKTVDGSHLLTRDLRLAQLTAGFITTTNADGQREDVWLHTAKIDATIEELREIVASRKKAVIFYRFTPEGHALVKAIEKEYGAESVKLLAGETSSQERVGIVTDFQRLDVPQILVVQESVGGIAISLAAADYCIFTSCSFDYGAHKQARDRIWKKEATLTYIYVTCPRTIDTTIMKAIKDKRNASELMLDIGFERAAAGDVE